MELNNELINQLRTNFSLLRKVISKKVKLDEYNRGLCPFHQEKTSSFNIYQGKDRARYHCFGCGADGDIFNYLQRAEKLEFSLAIKYLQLIIHNKDIPFPFSLPRSEPAGHIEKINCFSSCQNYLNLKEDYEILLKENHTLREKLNLGDFQPSNEIKKIALEPKPQGEEIIGCQCCGTMLAYRGEPHYCTV